MRGVFIPSRARGDKSFVAITSCTFRDGYGGPRDKNVREALHQRPALLQAIAEYFFATVSADGTEWSAFFEFREATAFAIEP